MGITKVIPNMTRILEWMDMRRGILVTPDGSGIAATDSRKGNGSSSVKWWRDGSIDSRIRQGDLYEARSPLGSSGHSLVPTFQVRRAMASPEPSPQLTALIGQMVVVDMRSTYVCLGTLVGFDENFLDLMDADLHDFRDSSATREVYVYDSARLGIRRNRARVLVRQDDVVAITRFADIAAS